MCVVSGVGCGVCESEGRLAIDVCVSPYSNEVAEISDFLSNLTVKTTSSKDTFFRYVHTLPQCRYLTVLVVDLVTNVHGKHSHSLPV